MAYFSGPLCIA